MVAVFPTLAGATWPVGRKPIFDTLRTKSASGRETPATYWQFPIFEFTLSFNWLEAADLDLLEGLFLESLGSFGNFFFDAGSGDNSVTDQSFGTGDGATTTFTLQRSRGNFAMPVKGSFGARTAKVDGGAVSATFSDTDGTVTFAAAPAAGGALTWTGNYYYLCRFKNDTMDLSEFLLDLHELQGLVLRSIL